MRAITWIYRVALIGFLVNGAIGSTMHTTNTALADTPAIWSAANAITNAFQGAGIGAVVGLVIAIVTRPRKLPAPQITHETGADQ